MYRTGILSRRWLSTSNKPLFNKLLIANRGEITCRIIKTARKLGIKTVAVYSEPDASALFVEMADEAVCIGPAQSRLSYLNIDAILDAIKKTGADAVHPGYGFLSENAGFVDKVAEMGVEFIGPKASAMRMLGEKLSAKAVARKAGVNVIQGGNEIFTEDDLVPAAMKLGYPVMVKASSGGGGKGMRVAWNDKELYEGFRLSKAEAKSSFASDRVFVEKFIEDPRHVEIQIMGDKYGNVVYLNERECSVQRRNQKVVEEAPSVVLSQYPELRKLMGSQAASLAREVGYHCAGTCEFLLDSKRNFYFLEMNTRLQVEHPITEAITGLDLVELQLRTAAGEKLPITQDDVKINGWAFESRIYAEDPLNSFLPSIGKLLRYAPPTDPSVRIDSGVEEGSNISIYYDPMISKMINTGATREEALAKANLALDSYVIRGVRHNINFVRSLYTHPEFIRGNISTKFIERFYPTGFHGYQMNEAEKKTLLSTALLVHLRGVRQEEAISDRLPTSKPAHITELYVTADGQSHLLKVLDETHDEATGQLKLKLQIDDDAPTEITSPYRPGDLLIPVEEHHENNVLQFVEKNAHTYSLIHRGTQFDVQVLTPHQKHLNSFMPPPFELDSAKFIISPMPGQVFSVKVQVGDVVPSGEEICVVEAMKMQNILRTTAGGKVKAVRVKAGDTVAADDILVEFE